MSKVACLNETKAIRAENTALGLLLWPLLCCQPGQGNAAFLVSPGLWIWENRSGTMPREPFGYKSRDTYFSVAVYDFNRTQNAPNSLGLGYFFFFNRLSRRSFTREAKGCFEAAERC